MIHSFDVFDTLTTRRVLAPADVFLLQAEALITRGLWSKPEIDWQHLRVTAELNARLSQRSREVTLQQIYEEIRRTTDLSDSVLLEARRLEEELEVSLSAPILENTKLLTGLASSGRRTVLISDMYLPCDVLHRIVGQAGVNNARIYASCEYGVTKASGGLFKLVAEREAVPLADLDHLGDNKRSDFRVPIQLGAKAKLYTRSMPSEDEKALYEATSISDPKARSVIAGAMRTARLANPYPQGTRQRVVWDVGAGVSGLLVLAFVSWTLQQARDKGLRRLYYVSRDGQLPSLVANMLCKAWSIPIEIHYLYGSRQAWHLPGVRELDDAAWNWLLEIPPAMTVGALLERAGLSRSYALQKVAAFGFNGLDQVLEERDTERCRDLLLASSTEILNAAAAGRDKAVAYLRQEGLFEDVSAGIVDIGWKGRLYTSLLSLLGQGERPARQIPALYLGLVERPRGIGGDLLRAYLFDEPYQPGGMLKKYLALYELMFSATHPGVSGYDFNERGVAVPVLRHRSCLLDCGWPIDVHQQAVLRLAEDVAPLGMRAAEGLSQARQPITRMLKRLFMKPSREEANAYGSAMFSEEQTESHSRELAPAFELIDSIRALISGGSARYASTMWLEGSISRGSRVGRTALLAGVGLLKSLRR